MTGVSRREALRLGGAIAAGLVVAPLLPACTDRSDVRRLRFLNWTDYIDPDSLDEFTTQTGIAVSYETYTSNDELARRLAQARRPRRGGREPRTFDLVVPSDNFVREFRAEGLLEPLDRSLIDNLGNLAPEFRDASYDPGNRYTVPWATGTTGIGYDATVFDGPPDWDVFLDSKYRGKMSLLDERRDAFAAALFSLGLDPNTRDQADIDAATDRLLEMKANLAGFDSGYLGSLVDGKLVAAQAFSSDVLQAKERNPDLDFTLPAQGALRWVDSLAVPTDAPSPENAARFIDFSLEPEVAARRSEFVLVDTGNAAAFDLLPSEVRDNPLVFPPPEVLDRLVFTEYLGDDEQRYADAWDRVTG